MSQSHGFIRENDQRIEHKLRDQEPKGMGPRQEGRGNPLVGFPCGRSFAGVRVKSVGETYRSTIAHGPAGGAARWGSCSSTRSDMTPTTTIAERPEERTGKTVGFIETDRLSMNFNDGFIGSQSVQPRSALVQQRRILLDGFLYKGAQNLSRDASFIDYRKSSIFYKGEAHRESSPVDPLETGVLV